MDPQEIEAGVRTVQQVADYFVELKASAAALVQRFTAQRRGYFTPDEEDDTLGLLVSYWQTRSALLDLICTMRREAGEITAPDPACFLVAFAAASILVDAARFLRETVDNRPVVRNKLNEPAPQFGIPSGVYDTIQKSLVSARHGWHLYHAREYYRQHAAELREVAARIDALPLLRIVDGFNGRLEVTVGQFSRAQLRTRGDQIVRQMAWTLLGRALYGLQKLAGILASDKYVRPGHIPQLPSEIAHEVLPLLAPGDVLVVRKEYALTNYFLPGYWPHAALYLGTAEQIKSLRIQDHENVRMRWERMMALAESAPGVVLESMKDGVQLRSVTSPFSVDSIVVLRPNVTADEVARGIARVLAHESKPYDFDFDFRRSDRLVCTEVVYRALDGMGSIRLPLTKRAGRPTLSGGDLLKLALRHETFTPVAVYAPGLNSGLIRGSGSHAIIARAEQCALSAEEQAQNS